MNRHKKLKISLLNPKKKWYNILKEEEEEWKHPARDTTKFKVIKFSTINKSVKVIPNSPTATQSKPT